MPVKPTAIQSSPATSSRRDSEVSSSAEESFESARQSLAGSVRQRSVRSRASSATSGSEEFVEARETQEDETQGPPRPQSRASTPEVKPQGARPTLDAKQAPPSGVKVEYSPPSSGAGRPVTPSGGAEEAALAEGVPTRSPSPSGTSSSVEQSREPKGKGRAKDEPSQPPGVGASKSPPDAGLSGSGKVGEDKSEKIGEQEEDPNVLLGHLADAQTKRTETYNTVKADLDEKIEAEKDPEVRNSLEQLRVILDETQGAASSVPASNEVIIHSAPKRTSSEIRQDIARESLHEFAIQFLSILGASFASQAVNHKIRGALSVAHATAQNIPIEKILTHTISGTAEAVVVAKEVVDVFRDINKFKKENPGKPISVNWLNLAGRIVATGLPFGLHMASIATGTAEVSGLPLMRAAMLNVISQVLKRIAPMKTHANPASKDDWKGQVLDGSVYGLLWYLLGSYSGYSKRFLTGSSGLASGKLDGEVVGGIFVTAVAFAVIEGFGRVGFQGMRKALGLGDDGRAVPESAGQGREGAELHEYLDGLTPEQKRDATKSQINWGGGKPRAGEIVNELYNWAKSTEFYAESFSGLGEENKIGENLPSDADHALLGGLANSFVFGPGLLANRAGPVVDQKTNYVPYTPPGTNAGTELETLPVEDRV